MVTVQLPPAGRALLQALEFENSGVVAMFPNVTASVPLFRSVKVCAALVEPTFWAVKVSVVLESVSAGPVDVGVEGEVGELLPQAETKMRLSTSTEYGLSDRTSLSATWRRSDRHSGDGLVRIPQLIQDPQDLADASRCG
jgi:hypothetical protein